MDAVFVDGVPARITAHDFRRHHLYSFPQLTDDRYSDLIADAVETVYAMFPGVAILWDMERDRQVWFDKTTLCYRLLTAWLITDQYPDLSSRLSATGDIKRKKVDGVDVWFNVDALGGDNPIIGLRSNNFGRKALMMIQSSPRRALLRVERFV